MTEREFQKQLRNYHKTQTMPVELVVKLLNECGVDCMYEDETRDALEMAVRAMSVIEDIKAEINEFIKNPQFGDLSIGASCGAVRCLEIINKHTSGKGE